MLDLVNTSLMPFPPNCATQLTRHTNSISKLEARERVSSRHVFYLLARRSHAHFCQLLLVGPHSSVLPYPSFLSEQSRFLLFTFLLQKSPTTPSCRRNASSIRLGFKPEQAAIYLHHPQQLSYLHQPTQTTHDLAMPQSQEP